jgi:hypothetical protein
LSYHGENEKRVSIFTFPSKTTQTMIKETNPPKAAWNEHAHLLLLANAKECFERTQKQVKIARAMKAMEYDLPDIFEATGLQPEIIQSL